MLSRSTALRQFGSRSSLVSRPIRYQSTSSSTEPPKESSTMSRALIGGGALVAGFFAWSQMSGKSLSMAGKARANGSKGLLEDKAGVKSQIEDATGKAEPAKYTEHVKGVVGTDQLPSKRDAAKTRG